MTAIFYGVSPAVIALILHSCYRLAKLGMEDVLQWVLAVICFAVTVTLQAEVAWLFLGAGILGALYYGGHFRKSRTGTSLMTVMPIAPVASSSTVGKLLVFFLKAGSLTFGSGLVIVPFLQHGIVQQYGWLDERAFLVAVAVGMISPGPVVITATFVGFLVAGFWGSVAATVGIFLPSFILVLVAAPLLARYRSNRAIQGFVKGAYAAAVDEVLRIRAPLIASRRIATEPAEIGGRPIVSGDRLTLIWASANRDETVFGDPDEFRVDRDPATNLLYGSGIHVCPGAPLARMELRVILEELLKHSHTFSLTVGKELIVAAYPRGGFSSLPVSLYKKDHRDIA